MHTNLARQLSCLAIVAASLIAAPAHAQANDTVVVNEYDVFVDLPTAFAFIKLPNGWKFIGKLDAEQLRNLPPGTLTSLLPVEEAPTRLAGSAKQQEAKRRNQPL